MACWCSLGRGIYRHGGRRGVLGIVYNIHCKVFCTLLFFNAPRHHTGLQLYTRCTAPALHRTAGAPGNGGKIEKSSSLLESQIEISPNRLISRYLIWRHIYFDFPPPPIGILHKLRF